MSNDEHAKADAAAKQRTEDQKKHADDTRKKLKDEREAREKASKENAKAAGDVKPTPTQEENDMAASGVYLAEHETLHRDRGGIALDAGKEYLVEMRLVNGGWVYESSSVAGMLRDKAKSPK